MVMYAVIVALFAFVFSPVWLATPVHAQVHVDIGIHLPAPPRLIVVPEVRAIRYAPAGPGNIFFYNGQYWVFANQGWYVSTGYNGPWIVVAPQYVPRPVLLVPVRYYHVPPGHWKQWRREQPPHWDNEWGHDWASKRAWKGPDRDDGHGRGEGRAHGNGHGHGEARGHGESRGHAEARGHGESRGHGGER